MKRKTYTNEELFNIYEEQRIKSYKIAQKHGYEGVEYVDYWTDETEADRQERQELFIADLRQFKEQRRDRKESLSRLAKDLARAQYFHVSTKAARGLLQSLRDYDIEGITELDLRVMTYQELKTFLTRPDIKGKVDTDIQRVYGKNPSRAQVQKYWSRLYGSP